MNSFDDVKKIFSSMNGGALFWHHNMTRHHTGRSIIWFTTALDRYKSARQLTHEATFEVVWTVVPSLILILLAIPSLKLLYSLDFILYDYEPVITVKVIGHQWFWSYEYTVFGFEGLVGSCVSSAFDSYMLSEDELGPGCLRLLEVDNALIVPTNTYIRFLVTAVDVLHSWAVPSLGIKVDAVPGRLNQMFTFIKRPGEFYGQCSEICGVNHGFMPIKLVAHD